MLWLKRRNKRWKVKYYVRVGQGFQFAETSARPVERPTEARLDHIAKEEDELYSEDELKQMRAEALSNLGKQPSKSRLMSEKDVATMLTEMRGL